MKAEVITLTPELAKNLLLKNTHNRRIKTETWKNYLYEMQAGRWCENGMPIIISTEGVILDGQHRLLAVINCGHTIQEQVLVSDVSPDAMPTIDTGSLRTASDVLLISGYKNTTHFAAGVKKFLMLSTGYGETDRAGKYSKVTHPVILEYVSANENKLTSLFAIAQHFYKETFRIIPPSDYIAFTLYFNLKYNIDLVNEFWDSVKNRVGVGALLYNKLMANNLDRKKMPTIEKNALIIKAFNAFNSKKEVKLLKYSSEETFPILK